MADTGPTTLSLFSGVGGLDLGWSAATGGRVVGLAERDSYAAAVLLARMADETMAPAPIWCGDITQLPLAPFHGVDAIIGGFPCQDISIAGNGEGIDGERSGLWGRAFVPAIRELRPRFVFVENVGALLIRGVDAVLGDLAAMGYDTEWTSLRASAVGAPHRRERVFILAHAKGESRRGYGEPDNMGEASRPQRRAGHQSAQGARNRGADVADARCRGDELGHSGCRGDGSAAGAGQGDERREQWLRSDAGDSDGALADSDQHGRSRERERGLREERDAQPGDDANGRGGAQANVDDAERGGWNARTRLEDESRRLDVGQSISLFPPGPDDRAAWAAILAERPELAPALEPGFRVLADGTPVVVDASRADALRCAGNGVVPLQAAVAARLLLRRMCA